MRTVTYDPSPTLAAFHASNAFVRGIRGPLGSGKSVACCWEIWTRACEQVAGPDGIRRSRWLASRNTYAELTTTTLQTWLDWFPEERFGKVVYGAPVEQVCRWPLDDGTRVELTMWFLALDRPDHVKKLLSLEITGAWLNEAREQPKAILDAATGRVGRFPAKRDGGASWFGVIMDTNPPDSDHWWYRLAEEETPDSFGFWSQPPGDSDQAENIDNLPPGYYDRLKAGKSENWIRVYVRGEYGFVLDGRPVYPEFRDSMHVRAFELPKKGTELFGGMDFGLTPAGVVAWRMPNGQIRIHSELVAEDMGVKRFGAMWLRHCNELYPGFVFRKLTGDPAGNARGDDEQDTFRVLAGEKVKAVPAETNSFTIRREAFAAPLGKLVDGEPALLVHPQCRRLRKALAGGYHFKRMRLAGAERFHDVPDKDMHSHVAEAGQYLVLGMGGARELRRPDGYQQPRPRIQRSGSDYGVLD